MKTFFFFTCLVLSFLVLIAYTVYTRKKFGKRPSISKTYYDTKTWFQAFIYVESFLMLMSGVLILPIDVIPYWIGACILLAGVGLTPTLHIKWHRVLHLTCVISAIILAFAILLYIGCWFALPGLVIIGFMYLNRSDDWLFWMEINIFVGIQASLAIVYTM